MRLIAMLRAVFAGILLLPGLLPMLGQGIPAAQPSSSAPAPSATAFQVNANLVLVDVVLSDHGGAVRAVPRDKFHVYEDGVAQKITVFEEHKPEDGLRVTAYPPAGPNNYSDFPRYRISSAANVLLLDGLNTPLSNQMYVRKQMLEYLRNIPPGTHIAVFTLASRLRMVQGFTADSNVLAAALARGEGAQPSMVLDPDFDQQMADQLDDMSSSGATQSALSSLQQFQADLSSFQTDLRVQMTLGAMESLARYLSVIPGRKNLIWFSGSFPLTITPDAALSSPFQAMRNYSELVRQTDELLSAARVAVYPVDARGLMGLPSVTAGNSFSSGGSNGGSWGGRGRGSGARTGLQLSAAAAADQQFLAQTAQEHFSMQQIAEETGGEAFVDTNGLQGAVARAISEGSHYYTVGYVPGVNEYDGRFRKIRVEVEGGYQAAYRRGYYAVDPAKAAIDPQASLNAMNAAVARGAPPVAEILFKVRILAADDPAAKGMKPASGTAGQLAKDCKGPLTRYFLDFAVAPQAIGFSATADGTHHARLEVTLIAYDKGGKRLNLVDRGIAVHLTDALYNQVMRGGIPVHEEIDLPAGVIYLRLVVHDAESSRVGSTEVPLNVAKR